MIASKATLHSLIDELPDVLVAEAQRRILALRNDPVLRALLEAPEDDEPFTEEDAQALEEAEAEYERGEYITLEQLDERMRAKHSCHGE